MAPQNTSGSLCYGICYGISLPTHSLVTQPTIALSRLNRGMTEQLLERWKTAPRFEPAAGERVAQQEGMESRYPSKRVRRARRVQERPHEQRPHEPPDAIRVGYLAHSAARSKLTSTRIRALYRE